MTHPEIIPCVAMGAEAIDGMVRVRALTEDQRFLTWGLTRGQANDAAVYTLLRANAWGFLDKASGLHYRTAPTVEAGEAFALALLKALAEVRAEAAR
jgi:hypothetical protein